MKQVRKNKILVELAEHLKLRIEEALWWYDNMVASRQQSMRLEHLLRLKEDQATDLLFLYLQFCSCNKSNEPWTTLYWQ